MGRALSTWEQRVAQLLGNPTVASLPIADIDQHVYGAVRRFSIDSPRETFSDYTGTGTSFQLALPVGWVSKFSRVTKVEYPQGERPPQFLDMAEVQPYPDTAAPTVIQLNVTTPANGKLARVYWTLPWPLPDGTAGTDLIPDVDYEYVAKLAAAGAALELAGRAAANKKASLPSADFAGNETEEARWMEVAKSLKAEYEAHVGASGGPAPASATTDWDARPTDWGQTGGNWLLRPPRR